MRRIGFRGLISCCLVDAFRESYTRGQVLKNFEVTAGSNTSTVFQKIYNDLISEAEPDYAVGYTDGFGVVVKSIRSFDNTDDMEAFMLGKVKELSPPLSRCLFPKDREPSAEKTAETSGFSSVSGTVEQTYSSEAPEKANGKAEADGNGNGNGVGSLFETAKAALDPNDGLIKVRRRLTEEYANRIEAARAKKKKEKSKLSPKVLFPLLEETIVEIDGAFYGNLVSTSWIMENGDEWMLMFALNNHFTISAKLPFAFPHDGSHPLVKRSESSYWSRFVHLKDEDIVEFSLRRRQSRHEKPQQIHFVRAKFEGGTFRLVDTDLE